MLAPVITRIFEQYATGNVSVLDVARTARSDGMTYRKSKDKVSKATIHTRP